MLAVSTTSGLHANTVLEQSVQVADHDFALTFSYTTLRSVDAKEDTLDNKPAGTLLR